MNKSEDFSVWFPSCCNLSAALVLGRCKSLAKTGNVVTNVNLITVACRAHDLNGAKDNQDHYQIRVFLTLIVVEWTIHHALNFRIQLIRSSRCLPLKIKRWGITSTDSFRKKEENLSLIYLRGPLR